MSFLKGSSDAKIARAIHLRLGPLAQGVARCCSVTLHHERSSLQAFAFPVSAAVLILLEEAVLSR